jgi:hypothetical protein
LFNAPSTRGDAAVEQTVKPAPAAPITNIVNDALENVAIEGPAV